MLSVVIPVYNEEGILRAAVAALRADLATLGARLPLTPWSWEIVLAENGSTDATVAIARELAAAHPDVRTFSTGEPNYGKALRAGIAAAAGTWVICEEIDLCDDDFHLRALRLLLAGGADVVIGSKAMAGANDERPVMRRLATRVMSGLLRVALEFRGTDTHGLKAFARQVVLPVVDACVVDRDLFASELVIRAARRGLAVVEIPVTLAEKRPPAVNLIKRVPHVLRGLAKLTWVIRVAKRDRGAP